MLEIEIFLRASFLPLFKNERSLDKKVECALIYLDTFLSVSCITHMSSSRTSLTVVRKPVSGTKKLSLSGFYLSSFRRFLRLTPPRVLEIVSARYGAGGNDPMTLEEIGQTYGITRERIRQIVSGLLRDVRGKRCTSPLEEVAKKIEWTLKKRNGILGREAFFRAVAKENARERGAVRFFLAVLFDRFLVRETDVLAPSVVLSDFDMSRWQSVNDVAVRFFSDRGSVLSEVEFLKKLKKDPSCKGLNEEELLNFLSVSLSVRRNPFGEWGLPEWSDICPRGTRERAYLVVRSEKKPLHFREIAQKIDAKGLQKSGRVTHPQTVHNELIKDKRFVLVGRGTYALVEWGYRRGTVREVIRGIFEDRKKPVSRREIVSEVLKVRDVKESTIVINLNAFFAKVGNDSYFLKEGKESAQ